MLRILIVEDNPVNQRLLRAVLQKRGHAVVCAADAPSAIAELGGDFDIALIDRNVPGGGGHSVLRQLRARPGGSGVPAVAITASSSPSQRDELLASGFDAFVPKPINIATFAAEIEAIASRAGASAPAAGRADDPAAARLARRLAALRAQYIRALPAQLEAFDAVLTKAREEPAALDDAIARAHQIAGSAGAFGLEAVSDVAREIESALLDIADAAANATATKKAPDLAWAKVRELARSLAGSSPNVESDPSTGAPP